MKLLSIRNLTVIAILGLVAPAVPAEVNKKQCKAHATSIQRLSSQLGVTTSALGASGRSLLGQVQDWIGEHDDAEVEQMATAIAAALDGVKACESGGFFAQVTKVKPQARTLKSAVLPWFRNAAALDPCQETIGKAMEKRDTDPDATITELTAALDECRDEKWIRETHRRLAETYLLRGDLSRGDFASGREQVTLTLASSGGLEPELQKTVTAILARTMIEGGRTLMNSKAYDEAIVHWQAYIETFGTAGFEPMFASRQVSDGAQGLRSLRNANHQWALACLEQGDTACVAARTASGVEASDAIDALEALADRCFEIARERAGAEGDAYRRLAFDLLDRWHTDQPGSYQIKRLLQRELLDLPPDERMRLVRLAGHCWVAIEIAGMLRQNGREFIDEATFAASCGDGNGEAAAMLAAVRADEARSLLDRVVLASSAAERATYEAQLEAIIASMGDIDVARELRDGLEAERARQRAQVANVVDNSAELYADCTTILATIQWNEAREKEVASEIRNFKTGCCTYLRNNRSGWVRYLKAKLGDDQVQAKQRLMDEYCSR